MKRWNRILAALLAALMLCGAFAAAAEVDVELETPSNAGEVELEFDPEAGGAAILDEGLELDDLQLAPMEENLVSSNEYDDEEDEADEEEEEEEEETDDDFEIDANGVLVEYDGPGGAVVIPDGVTGIGDEVFYECESLTSVTLPNSVTSIGDCAFAWCTNLASINIPDGVNTIGEDAFWGCASLTAISIPASVTSIGYTAFGFCASLDSISVSADNPSYVSNSGILYTRDMKTLLTCPATKSSVTIPASVKNIADWAFAACKLTSVTVPQNVTGIGENAFWACGAMTTVTLSKGLASIGMGAFQDCNRLKTITVPSSVTLIDGGAFCGCSRLADVYILAKKIKLYDYYYTGDEDDDEDRRYYTFGGCSGKLVIHTVIGSDAASWALDNELEVDDTLLLLRKDTSYNLKVGNTIRIMLENVKAKSYTSSNKKIATVNNKGVVTAKSMGTAKITVKLTNGKKYVLTVKVPDPVALSETALTLSVVDSAKLKLIGGLKRKVTWSSSNVNVAKIANSNASSATIKGVKPGTAVITAKVEGGKTLKCKVKVVNPLTISKSSLNNGKLYLKFTNNSNKKMIYIKFDILQYNNRGDKLQSPYSYYYLNEDLKAHSEDTYYYWVNDDTKKIKIKITEVTFSDKTTWKP